MRAHFRLHCGACLLVLPLLRSQDYHYVITDLESGTNQFGVPYAMNSSGAVVGDANFQAFLWSKGSLTLLAPGTFSSARGINDIGQVVGGIEASAGTAPFMFDHGVFTVLAMPAGINNAIAMAINNAGQIAVNAPGVIPRAFVSDHGIQQELASPGGRAVANGMNQVGDVVGGGLPAGAVLYHAFLWSRTQTLDLGTLPGGDGSFSIATAIDDAGDVVGQSVAADQFLHAFVWTGGAMHDLGTLPGDNRAYATSINNQGQVVGWSGHSSGIIIDYTRAVLWDNGSLLDLNSVLPPGSGWVLDQAVALNDRGQITGIGHRNGLARPFLLTPAGIDFDPMIPAFRAHGSR